MECILTKEKLEDENFMDNKITIQYTQNLHPYYLHIYYPIVFMHGRNLSVCDGEKDRCQKILINMRMGDKLSIWAYTKIATKSISTFSSAKHQATFYIIRQCTQLAHELMHWSG